MIAIGHPPSAVWKYTPRQVAGFIYFAARRRKREIAEMISIHAMAARGDPKKVKEQLKKLEKDD